MQHCRQNHYKERACVKAKEKTRRDGEGCQEKAGARVVLCPPLGVSSEFVVGFHRSCIRIPPFPSPTGPFLVGLGSGGTRGYLSAPRLALETAP